MSVAGGSVHFVLDGRQVEVPAVGTLLDALRDRLGVRSPKDGCSPQGQCGCCTVWVDGAPRVACVTPVARVVNRQVTTIDAMPDAAEWADAFTAAGASQCGFCTPGIIMRVAALSHAERSSPDAIRRALLAHLCRCTGWLPIIEAVLGTAEAPAGVTSIARTAPSERSRQRAEIEGGVGQDVGPEVALGRGGFADDTAPAEALVAVRRVAGRAAAPSDEWAVGETLAEARAASGKVQGRRTTAPLHWPIEVPPGDWARTLRTTWVEPAYLEPDASWCRPGGEPASPLGNGGAFGGKLDADVDRMARLLADRHQRPVRVLWSREDVVRFGPKRPPMAVGVRRDGTGVVHVARTEGVVDAIRAINPLLEVHEIDVAGPPTSIRIRGAGWAEVAAVMSSLTPTVPSDVPSDVVVAPSGARATARIDADGAVRVTVECGADPDDPTELTVVRSYCTGAAHMALGWVRSEAIAVDHDGQPLDLTIRSFGILRAVDLPPIDVEIVADVPSGPQVNGSDAVFAAVAAAAWRHAGYPTEWPLQHRRG